MRFVLILLLGIAPAAAQIRPVGGEVARIITEEALAAGIDPTMMRVFAAIESSGSCTAVTGSYKGLFQLSDAEFRRRGGSNIWDCRQNARAAALKIVDEANDFQTEYGRDPRAIDHYMIHQQGTEGYAKHLEDPERLAWRSMCATGEGKQKGIGWCRLAIWGNVPGDVRSRFGDVDHVTSRQFVELWRMKVEGPRPPAPIPVAVTTKPFPAIRECAIPAYGLRAFPTIRKPRP